MAVDSSGYVLLAGLMGADFEDDSFSGGNMDAFVMKVDLLGTVIWSKLIGSSGDDVAYGGKCPKHAFVIAAGSLKVYP